MTTRSFCIVVVMLSILAVALVACEDTRAKWEAEHREMERDCPKAGPGWRVAFDSNVCEWRREWLTPEEARERDEYARNHPQ